MSSETLRDILIRPPFQPVTPFLPSEKTFTTKNPELHLFTDTGRTIIVSESDQVFSFDVMTWRPSKPRKRKDDRAGPSSPGPMGRDIFPMLARRRGRVSWRRMMRICLLLLFALGSCLTARAAEPPREVTIFVSANGWHTGLHLPVARLRSQAAFPLPAWVRSYDWIEIGWGAREFYMHGRPDVGLAARTLFTPNPSVLHVVGVSGTPTGYFPRAQVRPLRLTPTQFALLSAKLGTTFERDARGAAVILGRGLYGNARFYAARGSYYFPKTCNVWTARQLRDAGLPFCPALSTASGAVMMQARFIQRRQR